MLNTRHANALVVVAIAATLSACSKPAQAPSPPPPPLPAAERLASDAQTTDEAIRFLEGKAKADKLDIVARNQLVSYYLQRLRETGNLDYLKLASTAARESLEAVPAERNTNGLAAQALVDFATHDFASALEHATQLTKVDGDKLYPYLLIVDTQLELGDYDKVAAALPDISNRSGDNPGSALNLHTRLARVALLRGRVDDVVNQYTTALQAARAMNPSPQESVAWCYWQLGETAFLGGNYDQATARYNDALTTFPDYYRALASLARVQAARGDLTGAIASYERVTKIVPDPSFVAALGDLYALSGRDADAKAQYALVEQIGHLSELNGVVYNRQLALFWADHDLNAEKAYTQAKKEYEIRKDIYGADAVAWTALKAGKLDEARAASAESLRLGTQDPRLFYHAGMIAKAAGDAAGAQKYLKQALDLSPQFDPLQAKRAREALGQS